MPKILPALIAEAIGTFGLCFVGIMAIHQMPDNLLGVALAHGLILAIMISAFGATSGGHHNPAVTIGLLVGGAIKPQAAFLYILAQVVGGVVAGLMVIAIFGQTPSTAIGATPTGHYGANIVAAGTPALAKGTSVVGGCLAELVGTFFLVTAVWGTAVDPRAPKIGGFGIGLTVAADILAIGPLTGGAMNPARAFGPAIAATMGGADYAWGAHLIYWVGPILGGILASVIYKNVIWPKTETEGLSH